MALFFATTAVLLSAVTCSMANPGEVRATGADWGTMAGSSSSSEQLITNPLCPRFADKDDGLFNFTVHNYLMGESAFLYFYLTPCKKEECILKPYCNGGLDTSKNYLYVSQSYGGGGPGGFKYFCANKAQFGDHTVSDWYSTTHDGKVAVRAAWQSFSTSKADVTIVCDPSVTRSLELYSGTSITCETRNYVFTWPMVLKHASVCPPTPQPLTPHPPTPRPPTPVPPTPAPITPQPPTPVPTPQPPITPHPPTPQPLTPHPPTPQPPTPVPPTPAPTPVPPTPLPPTPAPPTTLPPPTTTTGSSGSGNHHRHSPGNGGNQGDGNTKNKKKTLPLILGAVAGSLVFIVLVVVVIKCCVMGGKKGEAATESRESPREGAAGGGHFAMSLMSGATSGVLVCDLKGIEREAARKRIRAFYAEYNPTQMAKVDSVAMRMDKTEEDLMRSLRAKYPQKANSEEGANQLYGIQDKA